MKKILIIMLMFFSSMAIGDISVIGGERMVFNDGVTILCVDGYKYIIVRERTGAGVALTVTQMFESEISVEDNLPVQAARCSN